MRIAEECGTALVAAVMAMTLMASLAAAVILATTTETMISLSYREAAETFYAAETGLEYAIQELRETGDWRDVLSGDAESAFVDGAPSIDLDSATADINTFTPRGASSYSLYAYGPLRDLVPTADWNPRSYIAVWVADRSPSGSGEITVGLAAEAFGPTGSRRAIEATIGRIAGERGTVELRSWSELR
jgi:hypothetical protein